MGLFFIYFRSLEVVTVGMRGKVKHVLWKPDFFLFSFFFFLFSSFSFLFCDLGICGLVYDDERSCVDEAALIASLVPILRAGA